MKIAFIGQKGIPATFGGVEYHVDQLSRELSKQGHHVLVYVRDWYTEKNLKNYQDVKLIHLPTIQTKHLDASFHSLLGSFHAIFSGVDIIHYHGIGPAFFSIIPKILGKKIVVTVHRLDWATEKWGRFAKAFLKLGEYVSTKIPQTTIVVSEDLQTYFKKKHGKDTAYLPNGINLSQPMFPNLISKKYHLERKAYILFMGRLSPEKRVDWLIRAYQSVTKQASRSKNIKLVIAGGSSATEDYIQSLKALSNNNPEIIFTGYVTGSEKAELLSNALIFVLPSYLEGYPVALLEAMSYGLCILASDIPPNREIIQHGEDGVLFETNNFSDLTSKLIELTNNPRTIAMFGEKAQKKTEERTSWHDVVKETEKIYRAIFGGSKFS
jgi:glycosyltransferase involved in cell wall biosynthesis